MSGATHVWMTTNDATTDDEVQFISRETLFSATGRIGRASYFLRGMVAALYIFAVSFSLAEIRGGEIAVLLLVLPAGYFNIVQIIKRLHDRGHSGWFTLLAFVPGINVILGLYLLFAPGMDGSNQYGAR